MKAVFQHRHLGIVAVHPLTGHDVAGQGIDQWPHQSRNLADHVLTKFDKDEAAEVDRMIARAADAAETFITSGIAAVMNQFNGGDPATTE